MSLFKNSFGSSKTLPKPRKPIKVDTPVYSRIYPHGGESVAGFRWVGERVNFLTEMMKFLPTWEQVGYAGEPSEDFVTALGEFGNANGSPYWEGDGPPPTLWTEESGAPEPREDPNTTGNYYVTDDNGNPYHASANNPWGNGPDAGRPGRGYTRDHFGSWHRVTRSGLPWGFLEGGRAQNVNFHPGISEYNHFEYDPALSKYYAKDRLAYDRMEAAGIDDPLSAISYSRMLGFGADVGSYSDIWNSGRSVSIGSGRVQSVLSGGVQNLLASYGDQSFYQIIMSGFDNGANIEYGDASAAGVTDGERIRWRGDDDWDNNDSEVFFNGRFDYDSKAGTNGEDAFKLMVGLLESRRRIFYAMTEIFGGHRNIGIMSGSTPAPNDSEMIEAFDAWTEDRTRGLAADPHNLALFSLFLYAQHSLHSVLPSFSFNPASFGFDPNTSDGGQPGWIFSGKDQLAFRRFNMWMRENAIRYKDSLPTATSQARSYKGNVEKLIAEYYGEGDYSDQPYMNTRGDAGGVERDGWDKYSEWYNSDNLPTNGNPRAPYPHQGYLISQLQGMNLIGNRNGNVYDSSGRLLEENLALRNWAAHSVLSLKTYEDRDVGRNIAISTQNRRKSLEYKKAVEDYHWEKIELQREEMRGEAKMKQKVAEYRANLQALIKKAREQSDGLKMAQAASVRAKIEQKLGEKKSRQRRASDRKKK